MESSASASSPCQHVGETTFTPHPHMQMLSFAPIHSFWSFWVPIPSFIPLPMYIGGYVHWTNCMHSLVFLSNVLYLRKEGKVQHCYRGQYSWTSIINSLLATSSQDFSQIYKVKTKQTTNSPICPFSIKNDSFCFFLVLILKFWNIGAKFEYKLYILS